MSFHLTWGLLQIISLFSYPISYWKVRDHLSESFILTLAYYYPSMSFSRLSLKPGKCLVPKAFLFSCSLDPIPCHLPQNLHLIIFPFLSGIFNLFISMGFFLSLNLKSYLLPLLIMKQKTIESCCGISIAKQSFCFLF